MKKVAIALSGGVDSAVTAYLLKKKGFWVEGFFLKLKFNHPCLDAWRESEGRAALVAGKLGIPFHVVPAGKEFQEKIWESFWQGYKNGLTPNPCPFCNPQIKFGLLFRKVKKLGFAFLATGHYVRVTKEKGIWKIKKGIDTKEDQSYFLYRIPPKILPSLIFPLGEKKKEEVKKIAKKILGENFSQTPESQELCFVPEDFSLFAKKILPRRKGKIIDKKGKFLGEHEGIWFSTEGQRVRVEKGGNPKPFYVVSKKAKKNILVVSDDQKDSGFWTKEFFLKNVVWQIKPQKKNFSALVQVRYHARLLPCQGEIQKKKRIKVILTKPQNIVTPGQSAVFYEGDTVIGGGEIIGDE